MREEWKEYKFSDIAVFPPKVKLEKDKIYPFVLMDELDAGFKFVTATFEKEYNGSGSRFENGDTLFARITPSLENGKIAQVKGLKSPAFGSTEFYVFRGKEGVSDNDFIYYLSKTDWFRQNAINSYVGASGRQRADAKFIGKTKLRIPPLPTQKKIAQILSAYDDLIENNLKRIKLLEEMAQMTYEEWFVRLKFPGYKNVAIDAETGLPLGWRKVKLGEVSKINQLSLKKGFSGDIKYIDIASVETNKINSKTSYSYAAAPSRAKRIVKHKDIIWSCVRPNRKSHAIIWNPEENLIVSTGFCVISPENIQVSYLYQFVTRNEYVSYLSNIASGAAYPAVKPSDFEDSEIILPSMNILKKFDENTGRNMEIIWNLQTQNQHLKEARDILLPRLMTGRIDISEIN